MAEYYRTVFSITKQGLHGLDLIESASTVVFDWAKESMGPCEPVTDSPDEWDGVKGRLRVRRHVDHSFGSVFCLSCPAHTDWYGSDQLHVVTPGGGDSAYDLRPLGRTLRPTSRFLGLKANTKEAATSTWPDCRPFPQSY